MCPAREKRDAPQAISSRNKKRMRFEEMESIALETGQEKD